MEFCRFFRSVKFVLRSLGHFLGAVFACGYPDSAVTPERRRKKTIQMGPNQSRGHFNHLNHSYHSMTICGISLHHGKHRKPQNIEQKFIFQLATLSPHGINDRLSFH